ncbi:MAG: SPOR domain-containing protein [Alphaproteobacteria bacterium]|nr:SPOR domain-containing protein [Alphaproteobacteria bacterium]
MRFLLSFLGLLIVFPAFAGAPVEQNGPLSPCQGADAAASQPTSPWGVEIATSFSKQEALDEFASTKQIYASVLGDYEPVLIEQCDLHMGTDIRYSARIGMDSRDAADQLCAKLREAGGACIVQKN